jgi:sugar/nucleoside kinase (ribokinase family)
MSEATWDLVGVGQISIDHVGTVEALPSLGSKAPLLDYAVLPGGQVATALLAATRLGLRTRLVGAVGADATGELALAPLVAAGVDVTDVRRIAGATTRLAMILVDRASGERTVLGHRNARLVLGEADVPRACIADARCLLVDAEHPAAALGAARAARAARVPVVADVDALGPGVEALLAQVDFPLVSRGFAETFGRDGTVRSGLRRLLDLGARLAVATLGDRGCLALDRERERCGPAFAITPRDTTGAGDVFHAAFCWALLAGLEGEALLRAANAAAAISCTGFGAQGRLPARSELASFLAAKRPGAWRDPDPP